MALRIDDESNLTLDQRMQNLLETLPSRREVAKRILSDEPEAMSDIPLAVLIDYAYDQRERARKYQRVADAEKKVLDAMLAGTLHRMDEDGNLKYAGGLKGKCAITEEDVPNVEDWDELFEYIKENNAFELVERRIKAGAWRALNMLDPVPGTVPMTKRVLSLTKIPVRVTKKK